MIVANFNLSSTQMQVLLAFRHAKDTRTTAGQGFDHPMHDVDHTVSVLRKLCKDGYILWHAGDKAKKLPPGYAITAKGEMMLRLIQDELRRTLEWFDGKDLPESAISGGQHAVATGKAVENRAGIAVRKKRA